MTEHERSDDSCTRYVPAVNDLVDGTLDDRTRRELAGHLEQCPDCRALKADLERVRDAARAIEPHPPPASAWSRIERRLRLEGLARDVRGSASAPLPSEPGQQGRMRSASLLADWRWLAAAAAVVLVAAVVALMWRPPGQVTAPAQPTPVQADVAPSSPTPEALVESIEAELRSAEAHYAKAIEGLEQIAQAQQGTLDPQIADTLRQNMGVIDQAISESRQALAVQPESTTAQQSLFEALRRKVALLQDTIVLMNEMRKGNEAEAGRIVEGLNKS